MASLNVFVGRYAGESEDLEALAAELPHLEELYGPQIENYRKKLGMTLDEVINACPNLKKYTGPVYDLSLASLENLARRQLTHLTLTDCDQINEGDVEHIARKFQRLEKLSLIGCGQVFENHPSIINLRTHCSVSIVPSPPVVPDPYHRVSLDE